MCECERLLRCPNGTISASGSEDVYNCEVRATVVDSVVGAHKAVKDVGFMSYLGMFDSLPHSLRMVSNVANRPQSLHRPTEAFYGD